MQRAAGFGLPAAIAWLTVLPIEWIASSGRNQLQAVLRRRDAMKKKIDALVAKQGNAIFF